MPKPPYSFRACIADATRGDEVALSRLVRCYENKLRFRVQNLLGKGLRARVDPQDVVQSVHLTLIAGLRARRFQVHTPRRLLALACALARHEILHLARRLRCEQRHHGLLSQAGAACPACTPAFAAELDPARIAENKDLLDHVCGGLNDKDRELLELVMRGLDGTDIALRLRANPDSLRVRLSRLRRRLSGLKPIPKPPPPSR